MTRNQDKALAALLTSDTQAQAAEKSGLSVRTLRGYMSDPAFAEEYNRRRLEQVTDAARQIQNRLQAAVAILAEIMTSDQPITAARERIVAARSLLEFGLKYTELADIMTRIKALEERMEDEQ